MTQEFVLAIDQGTTSSRAIIFARDFSVRAAAQRAFPQYFPRSGWVEHNAEEILTSVTDTVREALARAKLRAADIAAVGITNQRETTVVWERDSGRAVHNAIVWQDRRTARQCADWRAQGLQAMVSEKTGLLLDPYFSASKLAWLLQDSALKKQAAAGKLLFGTIDAFLLWRLCGGGNKKPHKTDATNAARTMLYNIHSGEWDSALLQAFDVPAAMLPAVEDCAADFGVTDKSLFGGAMRISGIAGDQQAAAAGQACFSPGMLKATYGTGCFALLNTGEAPARSQNNLLTTVAYQLNGRRSYALEGSIFVAGACVQWLRDGLGIINEAAQSGALAALADSAEIAKAAEATTTDATTDTEPADPPLVLVPAFTGLGAPYWQAEARGAIFGLTRATGKAELARAALEAICLQTRDLLEAMQKDSGGDDSSLPVLRVDGGMAASDWTMQKLADILAVPVERPALLETTAAGAAYFAGLQAGIYPPPAEMAAHWRLQRRFTPAMPPPQRAAKYAQWQNAVQAVLRYTKDAAANTAANTPASAS